MDLPSFAVLYKSLRLFKKFAKKSPDFLNFDEFQKLLKDFDMDKNLLSLIL